MGMLYAILAGPSLGLALGLLGVLAGKAPFNTEYPTGAFAIDVLLQVPFGLLGIAIFALISGAYRDIWRVYRSRISSWNFFVATGGLLGDLSYACSVVLVSGAIAGPIGGLFGVVGALLAIRR